MDKRKTVKDLVYVWGGMSLCVLSAVGMLIVIGAIITSINAI